jgi:hypothetical protein
MEKLDLALAANLKSDTISGLHYDCVSDKVSNRILNYRKIQNWENFFLASAIYSVAKAAGTGIENFHFVSAITGDMFAWFYAKDKPCDSGITNYFFNPMVVKKAYAAFGRECVYISNGQIKKEFRNVMDVIKSSVDCGIPVLAWGMGNITVNSGSRYDPLPEGSLIGGYGADDLLYVNLYLDPKKAAVDDDGYTAITDGLNTTKGLFFAGSKIEKTAMKEIYRDAVDSIHAYLTLPPSDGYVFGPAAFELWADTLLDENNFEGKTDDELGNVCWNIHCSPYCCVCTSDAYNFIKKAVEQYPDLDTAARVLPLYERMRQYKDDIWKLQGGFSPPTEKFASRQFRTQIAEILREMGKTCFSIVSCLK